jgi:putative GTP pyrophosphokinase
MANIPLLEKQDFLKRYNISDSDFETTGLDWAVLQQIHRHHCERMPELENAAALISRSLQPVPSVHSTRFRIKHPEHLVEKLIRKKGKHPELSFNVSDYDTFIKDLIGIRALHLFKGDWKPIDEFIRQTWELDEPPMACVRDGDPEAVVESLKQAGFELRPHPRGYRSLHYVIQTAPFKRKCLAEIQVRTIFEEGWSEIDHTLSYPRQSDDPVLEQFLAIFNRVAGSADEMGTFIELLSGYHCEQTRKAEEALSARLLLEKDLATAVSKLDVTKAEKKELEQRVAELRRSSPLVYAGNARPATMSELAASGRSSKLSELAASVGSGKSTSWLSSELLAHSALVPRIGDSPFACPTAVCSRCSQERQISLLNASVPFVCDECRAKTDVPVRRRFAKSLLPQRSERKKTRHESEAPQPWKDPPENSTPKK